MDDFSFSFLGLRERGQLTLVVTSLKPEPSGLANFYKFSAKVKEPDGNSSFLLLSFLTI